MESATLSDSVGSSGVSSFLLHYAYNSPNIVYRSNNVLVDAQLSISIKVIWGQIKNKAQQNYGGDLASSTTPGSQAAWEKEKLSVCPLAAHFTHFAG
jgi:hypothetical protein